MPPTAGAESAIRAGSHGVSDPGARASNAPRVSAGVAHAIAAGDGVAVGEGVVRVCTRIDCVENVALIVTQSYPDDLVPFLREIRINEGHSFRARLCSRLRRVREARKLAFRRALRGNKHDCDDAPTITHSMLESVLGTVQGSSLRSARARARPAGRDGACAQIQFLAIT